MDSRIRIEIVSRSDFWRRAVFVEWESQHPQRRLKEFENGDYLIDLGWLEDLKSIAADCFSKVLVAPANPGRRLLFRHFVRLNRTKLIN